MSKEPQKSNFELAQEEANKIDLQIIDTLQKGYNFRVEAGAGSGKTYSLNKVIEWIQVNKWKQYRKKNQHVVCITYTNAAVDVISGRLANDSFIIPSTIHSFAWNAIKQYQSTLIKFISEDETFRSTEGDFFAIRKVEYTLGHRYNENGIMYLYHDDVIRLFAALLDNAKFRRVFSDKYPLILIDEYQDSLKPIIDRFLEYFISLNSGPQFGFFGDSWQTIYQSNKACGLIQHENIVEIKKGANFRSAPKIVTLCNLVGVFTSSSPLKTRISSPLYRIPTTFLYCVCIMRTFFRTSSTCACPRVIRVAFVSRTTATSFLLFGRYQPSGLSATPGNPS